MHYSHLSHFGQRVIDVEEVHMVTLVSQLGSATTMPPAHMSYLAIADDIRARVTTGEYRPGERLPSYAQLADLYSVSLATVRRAVRLLRQQGVVEGYPGKGVYVASVT
jgi:GntR family transcriptional regulator